MDFSLSPEIERLIVRVIYPNGAHFDRHFDNWLRNNPHIYYAILAKALTAFHQGHLHFGMDALFCDIRWNTGLYSQPIQEFKISNDRAADVARLITFSYPLLSRMFRLKARPSKRLGCFGSGPARFIQQSLDLH
jgi:hypothetical protein